MKLGTLHRVNLRSVWPSESSDFTPWLGNEDNLAILGDAIGIDLELEEIERNVGPYRADILCKDTGTDHWVLIENQIAKTDHTHLGQILTYAAGLNAVTIVWIAERFTEEHRAAIDWLNEITTEEIDIFGLEIELWRIGNSEPAPKFNVVCRPNEWTKGGGKTKRIASGDLTETKQLQLEYWTEFREFLNETTTLLKPQKPAPCHWLNFSIGTSTAHTYAFVDTVSHRIGVRLQLHKHPDRLDLFDHLESQKGQIEAGIGFGIVWEKKPEKHTSYLTVNNTSFSPEEKETWKAQFDWLRKTLESFRKHIPPALKSFTKPSLIEE